MNRKTKNKNIEGVFAKTVREVNGANFGVQVTTKNELFVLHG